MAKLYIPPAERCHPTIRERVSNDVLASQGLELTDSIQSADVLVAPIIDELADILKTQGNHPKILIWCDEPIWANLFTRLDKNVIAVTARKDSYSEVNVMNHFTGGVHLCNFHFIRPEYAIDQVRLEQESKLDNLTDRKPNAIAIASYRQDPRWEYNHMGVIGLCNRRTSFILNGIKNGFIHAFGNGFQEIPQDYKNENQDIFAEKLNIIRNYKYTVCIENSVAPYYVTEKIWHAIICNSLPIYYAGREHTIYQDFPQDSFIDIANFNNYESVFK